MPIKQNHELARSCFEEDFKKINNQKLPTIYRWELNPNFENLLLYVNLYAKDEDGLNLDDYHIKMDMSYYRTWPPGVTFINPVTKEFNPFTDLKWVPQIGIKPPGVDIAYHASYALVNGQTKQLVCNSMTLEYYLSRHNPSTEQRWNPSIHNFGTTINTLDLMLRKPYYGGRLSK